MSGGKKVYLCEIKEKSQVSIKSLRRLCEQCLLPAHRLPGGRWFVWEADLGEVERILAEAGHGCELTGVSIGQQPATLAAS